MKKPVFLSVEDVKQKYNFTNLQQFRMRRAGLPFYKFTNKLIKYDKKELEEWIESRKNAC
ncbi:hypothetical protein [Campylobacter armoricus]|uniref:Helix-turn-helix domain-containing protein n=1 Tax=Campylobacter armoricus TaxID=2505970 RepID=A0A7L5HQR3_9BACT|nr:hypothetical protein [Campylobacter armoricus]QKF79524.1 hypothetical protein CARM_0606 [Campylobacter armoricus]